MRSYQHLLAFITPVRLKRMLLRVHVVLYKSTAGGGALFTICLWRAGFALTDPGYSVFNPDAKLFDPFQYEVRPCACTMGSPAHAIYPSPILGLQRCHTH